MTIQLLLTGASGSLGTSLLINAPSYYEISSISHKQKKSNFINCDLTNKKKFTKILDKLQPDIIIHAAAITDLDFCEFNKIESKKVNYGSTTQIVKWIKKNSKKTKLIFISSDQIYGKPDRSNTEDKFHPINYYGKLKYESEKIVSSLKHKLILRVNFVAKGTKLKNSLSDWVLNSFKKNKKNVYYDNIFFNPITSNQLSKIIFKCIRLDLDGIFNVGSKNTISKAYFAIHFARIMGVYNKNYLINNYIYEKTKAIRPYDTSMNISKIEKYIKMPCFKKVLNVLKDEYK